MCGSRGSLLAVELVTAAGEILTGDAERDPDLFWALRGLGPNFGVATRFVYRTHPLGPVAAGRSEIPLGDAAAVLSRLGERATSFPGRAAAFAINVAAGWDSPAADGTQIGWARETHLADELVRPGHRRDRRTSPTWDAARRRQPDRTRGTRFDDSQGPPGRLGSGSVRPCRTRRGPRAAAAC